MGYIGNDSVTQNFTPAVDYFNGNGSTTSFTLSRTVGSAFDVQAFIENVPQNPSSAFTVAGNVITFTSAPPSGTNNIYVRYTSPVTQQVKPAPGTVSPTEINSAYSLWNLSGSDINYTAGNVGIGTSSPTEKLDVLGNTDTTLRVRAASDTALILNETTPNKTWKIKSSDGTLAFQYSSTAYNSGYSSRMLLDSSGNLQFASTTGAAIRWQNGYQTITGDAATDVLTYRTYATHVWKTLTSAGSNTDGTERMRINSGGGFQTTESGTYISNATYCFNMINWSTNKRTEFFNNNGSFTDAIIGLRASRNTTNGTWNFVQCSRDGVADCFFIRDSGNVLNSNGSYGTLSDVKLKENIVDATPKLNKINQLKVRNFNLIGEELKQIGFVAQEFEEVFPSMVEETVDKDENGNILDTTTKTIKTTVLIPILVKAIQEQQAIIEDLKARIEVLEAK